MKHPLPKGFLTHAVLVDLVGCGGNGSQMLTALARTHVSLRSLGHPGGLNVRVWDADVVTEANIGRQMFSTADLGRPKANVLVNRVNLFFGTDFRALCKRFDHTERTPDILIGCVDSVKSRREIASVMKGRQAYHGAESAYWLDLGNDAKFGQVVLGQFAHAKSKAVRASRLPNVLDLFKLDARKDDDTPSCSLAGALQRQDLFINQHVATWASTLLWNFFRQGGLDVHGCFINLADGHVRPLPIDEATWKRMGFDPNPAPLRRIVRVLKRAGRSVFDRNKVKLECGHITHSNGTKRARCEECTKLVHILR